MLERYGEYVMKNKSLLELYNLTTNEKRYGVLEI